MGPRSPLFFELLNWYYSTDVCCTYAVVLERLVGFVVLFSPFWIARRPLVYLLISFSPLAGAVFRPASCFSCFSGSSVSTSVLSTGAGEDEDDKLTTGVSREERLWLRRPRGERGFAAFVYADAAHGCKKCRTYGEAMRGQGQKCDLAETRRSERGRFTLMGAAGDDGNAVEEATGVGGSQSKVPSRVAGGTRKDEIQKKLKKKKKEI